MGFVTPEQHVMEEHRDQADQEHKAFWEQNGGSPAPEAYFPGFEQGWHDAAEALGNGNSIPEDDEGLNQWARQRAQECGQGEDAWEWQHGFIRGAKDCKQAGQQDDQAPEDDQDEQQDEE